MRCYKELNFAISSHDLVKIGILYLVFQCSPISYFEKQILGNKEKRLIYHLRLCLIEVNSEQTWIQFLLIKLNVLVPLHCFEQAAENKGLTSKLLSEEIYLVFTCQSPLWWGAVLALKGKKSSWRKNQMKLSLGKLKKTQA